jgi:hypothetical protein
MEETVDLPVAIDPVRPKRSILTVWTGVVHAVGSRGRGGNGEELSSRQRHGSLHGLIVVLSLVTSALKLHANPRRPAPPQAKLMHSMAGYLRHIPFY